MTVARCGRGEVGATARFAAAFSCSEWAKHSFPSTVSANVQNGHFPKSWPVDMSKIPARKDFGYDFINIIVVIYDSKNGAKSSALIVFVVVCAPCALAGDPTPQYGQGWASRIRKINAAAGGPWGKKVRRTSAKPVPAACTRSNASSHSPPPARLWMWRQHARWRSGSS